MTKLAILASGSGTTAEAVARATQSGVLDAEISLIVHNNPDAKVVDQPTIKRLPVATMCINSHTHPGPGAPRKGELTDTESMAIAEAAVQAGVDLVLLLGYMKRVRGALLDQFGFDASKHSRAADARMLNTHPGPLPQTRGLHGSGVHQRVFELYQAGELARSGPTLHAVAEDYDTGPIVKHFDEVVITDQDTAQTIEDRVRAIEREMLPIGINEFVQDLDR